MRRKRMAVLSIAMVLLMVGYSWAGEFDDPGGYLVIGGVTGFSSFQGTFDTSLGDSMGIELTGGYRFSEYLAAEFEVDGLMGFDIKSGTPRRTFLTVDGLNFTANGKVFLPLGRIQPYALVGLGGLYARLRSQDPITTVCWPYYPYYWYCEGAYAKIGDNLAFMMKYGGGVDFHLTDQWALSLDATYVMPIGGLEDLRYISFNWGALFKF